MPDQQQQINYGASANDGQGDPLRTAFIKTDDNFDAIWAAGPVGSNITILNNTVQVVNTNGDLRLSPQGIGNIVVTRPLVPVANITQDIGGSNSRFRTVWANALVANTATIDNFDIPNLITNSISSDDSSFVTFRDGIDVQGAVIADGEIVALGNVTAPYFIWQPTHQSPRGRLQQRQRGRLSGRWYRCQHLTSR